LDEAVVNSSRRRRRGRKEASTRSKALRVLDAFEGGLLLLLIVAAPWLFGCTERWSIGLMNVGGLLAGLGTLAFGFLTRSSETEKVESIDRRLGWAFFVSNVLVLLFCLLAVLNARATFSIETETFSYREGVKSWLPTSYDRAKSLEFLINSLGLFSFFWSLVCWIKLPRHHSDGEGRFQQRLKLVIWVFVVNGFLVALQGMLQRFSGSAKLLWFRPSYWDNALSCFGPFSYRGNAADYLNLIWPVSFGFWYTLARRRDERHFGIGDGPELLLLPMSLVTTAASFATLSRGGALVAAGMLLILLGTSFAARGSRILKISLAVTISSVLIVAGVLAGSSLAARFRKAVTDNMSGRVEIYENAHKLAADFPWFGSGPGTFMSVYQLYRANTTQIWAAFVHDDWLETRVTFGRIGMTIVLLQLVLLVFWTMASRKKWDFPALTVALFLSLGGCLVHAKRDFPFQTYGVFFTFTAACALLICTATPRKTSSELLVK
jgi:O-antigen ligase